MAMAKHELRGSVQGRPVLLEDDPGLPDGQQVTVRLTPRPPSDEAGRATLLRLAGAWADDAEDLDRFLEWNRQQRQVGWPELEG